MRLKVVVSLEAAIAQIARDLPHPQKTPKLMHSDYASFRNPSLNWFMASLICFFIIQNH